MTQKTEKPVEQSKNVKTSIKPKKTETKAEVKAEVKGEVKAETKTPVIAEVKTEVKAETTGVSETKTAVKAETKPKTKSKTESKTKVEGAVKTEVKADSKKEVKGDSKTEVKTETKKEVTMETQPKEASVNSESTVITKPKRVAKKKVEETVVADTVKVETQVGGEIKVKKTSKKEKSEVTTAIGEKKTKVPKEKKPKKVKELNADGSEKKTNKRTFKLISNGVEIGRYKAVKPKPAASKALSKYISKLKEGGQKKEDCLGKVFQLQIIESSRKNKVNKIHYYEGRIVRIELKEGNKSIVINEATGFPEKIVEKKIKNPKTGIIEDKVIIYKFENKVKRIKYETVDAKEEDLVDDDDDVEEAVEPVKVLNK